MSRKSKRMNPYFPALAGLMLAVGTMVGFSLFDKLLCKSGTCTAQFPWYIHALPVALSLVATAWTGKELYKQWHELEK